MPFTLAHPAAAVPLRRVFGRHAVLSALVIGSLAPDAVYFLPLGVSQPASHSLPGVFWFCLPLGLVAYAVFHVLVKVPVAAFLPVAVQRRLPPMRPMLPDASPLAVLACLAAGALTHVAWDAVTHAETLAARMLPWLRVHLFTVGGFDIPVWKLLQHVSTVVGLALLARWTAVWFRTAPRSRQPHVPVVAPAVKVAALVGLTVAVAGAALAGMLHSPPSEWSLAAMRMPIRRAVVAGLQAAGGATLVLALLTRILAARPVARTRARTP